MKLQWEKHTFPYDGGTDSECVMLALEVMRVNILINIFSFHFSYQLSWDLSQKKKNVDTANMDLFYLRVVEI